MKPIMLRVLACLMTVVFVLSSALPTRAGEGIALTDVQLEGILGTEDSVICWPVKKEDSSIEQNGLPRNSNGKGVTQQENGRLPIDPVDFVQALLDQPDNPVCRAMTGGLDTNELPTEFKDDGDDGDQLLIAGVQGGFQRSVPIFDGGLFGLIFGLMPVPRRPVVHLVPMIPIPVLRPTKLLP
ncbi:MAG: hypothetical protein ACE5JS_21625 [Nitrospinota bacterium]